MVPGARDLPHVVTHNAASVDGRIDGIDVDLGTFYGLAARWDVDAHLVGCDTLLEGMAGSGENSLEPSDDGPADVGPPPEDPPAEPGSASPPMLVVPDSRGRVGDWHAVRAQPFWDDVLVLCSATTDETYVGDLDADGIDYLRVGDDHVDYDEALAILATDYAVETVLVDSGGTLSGHLHRAGLVDEVSVLVHPRVVGGTSARSFVRGPDPADDGDDIDLGIEAVERLDDDLVWLRYAVR